MPFVNLPRLSERSHPHDEAFTVNGKAKGVCGKVQTANATVYIIDGVLLPPAS